MTRFRNRSATLLTSLIVAGAGVSIAPPATAQFTGGAPQGYLGAAFVQLPGVKGSWKGEDHRGWIMIDGHYWDSNQRAAGGRTGQQAQSPGSGQQAAAQSQQRGRGLLAVRARADIPRVPRSGQGKVIWSIDKRNASLAGLMNICRSGTTVPELAFSVSADRSRPSSNLGPLPPEVPAWFQYTLKDVRLGCPVVEGAAEQAIIVEFNDIAWTNWTDSADMKPVHLVPASLPAIPNQTGETKSWVLTWFGTAHDIADDQCPNINAKPPPEAYYALMSAEEAAKAKLAFGDAGPEPVMAFRGPERLNVTALPGIVPDPGLHEPQTTIGRGINLDGGKGAKRRQYVSADGTQTGIANQLYTVEGCINGKMGRKGLANQFFNGQMRDGHYSIMLTVHGIDDERNDKEVWVTLQLSNDPMAKAGVGGMILADYSFRPSTNPEYGYYTRRMRGKIVDGVVITEPVDRLDLNLGVYSNPAELKMYGARMRLNLESDGKISGVLGGYIDWRSLANTQRTGRGESYMGYDAVGVYYSLKRNADGLKNPITGQYDGISTAYDIEGVPAIVVDPTTRQAAR
jgi:hypothetical protein